MKTENSIPHSARGQTAKRRYRRFSILMALVLVFSLVMAGRPAAAQSDQPADPNATWNIQLVEDPPVFSDMTDRSLRIDGSGNPHIAFGGDHLYYARWNPSTNSWFKTVVDYSPNVGSFASIAVDSLNNPRIAYYDSTNGSLKFAYSQNGGYNWNPPFTVATFGPAPVAANDPDNPTIEQAQQGFAAKTPRTPSALPRNDMAPETPAAANVGGYTSIATDSQNRVHISYYNWTNRSLEYAMWDGANWTYSIVDQPPQPPNPPDTTYDVGKYSSIAVDQNGYPHISYMDEKYDGLKYASFTGTGWSLASIDTKQAPNFRFGGFTSLALDSSGNAYISYQEWQNNDLKFAQQVSSGGNCGPNNSWRCQVVDSSNDTGFYTSIARLSSSNMVISYGNATSGSLLLARSSNNGNSWSRSTIVSTNQAWYFTSVALNSSGYPGISYYSAANGMYSYIQQSSSGWSNTILSYAGSLSPLTSLAIGSTNIPNISYFNDTGDQLMLAATVGYGFSRTTVATNGSGFSSVAVNSLGMPSIAYYNLASNNLTYAYISNGVWYFQTVDSNYGAGMYPSLKLDSSNRPYISYYDGAEAILKFAYYNGSAWVVQTVDNTTNTDVGQYSSLTLSKSTNNCYALLPTGVCPMISYYDATNQTLKHAFLSVIGAWVNQVVDNSTSGNKANVGQYSSIAVDYAGALHISYYDATYGFLKHAIGAKGASAWTWTTAIVDNTANVGQYTSTIANPANTVFVSYYDVTHGYLKMATLTGGTWSLQVVDQNANTGQGTSIAVFTDGSPAISYYDVTNGAVKLATTYTGLYGKSIYLPTVYK